MYPHRRDLTLEACERGGKPDPPRTGTRRKLPQLLAAGLASFRRSHQSYPAKPNVLLHQPTPAHVQGMSAIVKTAWEKYSHLPSFLFRSNRKKHQAGQERTTASARTATRRSSYSCPTTKYDTSSRGNLLGSACEPRGELLEISGWASATSSAYAHSDVCPSSSILVKQLKFQ